MKGKIVASSIPFIDSSSYKPRPALVLHETEFDVVVAYISQPSFPLILIGQLDKVLDDFGKPVRILIHQAVPCPVELNQPGAVDPLGHNKRILRRHYDILRAGDYKGGRFYRAEPVKGSGPRCDSLELAFDILWK